MTKLHDLAAAGTSPWLDNIRRGWLKSGEFKKMVDDGVLGVTSNPTIFQKAIADSSDYDEAIAALAGTSASAEDVFFELAIEDVREAADQIRPVYDDSGHLDGFVSFELPPKMANDSAASIAAAPDFFGRIGRPNIYIKIPGTAEGVPAIEETIAAGINVNVTLLFSLAQYEAIHMAYIRGLERRLAAHQPIADVHSVASFFVSRVDTAIDPLLPEGSPLRGRAAVANAKLAYQRFGEIVASDRWRKLAEEGATVQRTLWASTGTKNPEYSDVLYVDDLIGPDCVNTMPEGTIAAFQDHGTVARTVDADVDGARAEIDGAGRCRRVARRRHPQARGRRREVVLGLVRFADRDDPAESRRSARRLMATTAKRPAPNPLRAGLRVGGASEPTVFVIYGASGDLSQRKLLPAIYNLAVRGLLPNRFAVIGYARSEMDNDAFREYARTAVEKFSRTPVDDHLWRAFAESLHYQSGSFDEEGFKVLGDRLEAIDAAHGTGANRVYYLSTPASFFPVIVQAMGATKLNKPGGFARVVIEKPFGHDLGSARELADVVHRPFSESQIYRIDHYLGKETVQNIFAFRFANAIFEPVWNNTHVDHVQITVGESIGVEHRAAFYEETGVVRDIVQNHLLQVFALVAMEPPAAFNADPIRDEKAKLLRATGP